MEIVMPNGQKVTEANRNAQHFLDNNACYATTILVLYVHG